jgi:hypothetical protein
MIHTDGTPTIAWANPPEDDESDHERATGEGMPEAPSWRPTIRKAWEAGYDEAREGRGDFGRRNFDTLSGERAAYMRGRAAYFAAVRERQRRAA